MSSPIDIPVAEPCSVDVLRTNWAKSNHELNYTDHMEQFTITQFFNELPVRVINTDKYPMFYADDVLSILGLKRGRRLISEKFNENHIVSDALREELGITTYRENGRAHNKITLLNEFGVYHAIGMSTSQRAEEFRIWTYNYLFEKRSSEVETLRVHNETLLNTIGMLQSHNETLQKQQKKFIKRLQQVYVFRIHNRRNVIVDQNLHSDDECSVDAMLRNDPDWENENTIDDIDNYNAFLEKYPNFKPNDSLFKIVATPTTRDYTEYEFVYKYACVDAAACIETIKKKLFMSLVDCKHDNIFDCTHEELISHMNERAVAID